MKKISFRLLRKYTEMWSWEDEHGNKCSGTDVPKGARFVGRVPYFVRYITRNGDVEQGEVVTLSVDTRRMQRKVQFVKSTEVRIIRDYLIIEVNGIRFLTH